MNLKNKNSLIVLFRIRLVEIYENKLNKPDKIKIRQNKFDFIHQNKND